MRRFAYRLALKLGRPNVDAMLAEMTWAQLEEWQVFEALEPFDEYKADFRTAQIVATLLNVNRGEDSPVVKIKDVLLAFGDAEPIKQEPEKDWKALKAMGKMMSALFDEEPPKRRRQKAIAPMPDTPRRRRRSS